MATQPTKRRKTTTTRKARPDFKKPFLRWLNVRDAATELSEEQQALRDEITGILQEFGYTDDNGHHYIDLPEPISFKDHDRPGKEGKGHVYTTLKLERHLIPAQPTPDPELAESYFKRKRKWITARDKETLEALQAKYPFLTLSVDIDTDAVTKMYFADSISEAEYTKMLIPQREQYQFKPSEA